MFLQKRSWIYSFKELDLRYIDEETYTPWLSSAPTEIQRDKSN